MILNNIGWLFFGGYKNILPSMLTILPLSSTWAILLASRALYSCIPRKRAIQYYIIIQITIICIILIKTHENILLVRPCNMYFGGNHELYLAHDRFVIIFINWNGRRMNPCIRAQMTKSHKRGSVKKMFTYIIAEQTLQ